VQAAAYINSGVSLAIGSKLTAIPHSAISNTETDIRVNDHNIAQLGPNEFSVYTALTHLYLVGNPLADNIDDTAFLGPPLIYLNLQDTQLTRVPAALMVVKDTLQVG
jgi:hypothetical protein